MRSILKACNDPNDLIVHIQSGAETILGGMEEVSRVEMLVDAVGMVFLKF